MEHVGYVDLTFNLKVTTSFFSTLYTRAKNCSTDKTSKLPNNQQTTNKNRLFDFDL